MITRNFLLLILLMAFQISGCARKTVGSLSVSDSEELLVSKKWIIQKLGILSEEELTKHKTPYIQFNSEKNRIFGNTGCNNFFGTYELNSDGKINITGIGATKMFCIESMKVEDAFVTMLNNSKFISLTDSTLIFKDTDKKPLASFSTE